MKKVIIITSIILIISMGVFIKVFIDYKYNENKFNDLNNKFIKIEKKNEKLKNKVSSIYKDDQEYTLKVVELEVWKKELAKVKR